MITTKSNSIRYSRRTLRHYPIGLCASILLAASPVTATTIQSTFDSDTGGWVAASVDGDTGQVNYIANVIYNSTGGNPGGFISINDLDADSTFLGAPSPFLGDISFAYGGTFQFDHIDLTTAPGGTPLLDTPVGLVGNNRVLVFIAPLAETTWQTRIVPMQEDAGWVDFFTGTPVSQAEFLGVLSDVELLGMQAETRRLFFEDLVGLDNVILTDVPEPSSLILLSIATALLAVAMRCRRGSP